MKLFTKICLILSAVCIGIAAICLGVGMALGSGIQEVKQMADDGGLDIGNWHIGNYQFFYSPDEDDLEIEEGSVVAAFPQSEVENLDIDIRYGEVSLKDSDSEQIEITVDAPKGNTYKCENDNGTVILKDKTPHYKWNGGFAHKYDVKITIAIPEGKEFEEVKMVTNAGTIESTHDFVAEKIKLDVDAGELIADYLEAKEEFSIDVGAGRLEISDIKADSLDVDCGVGEVELTGTVSDKAKADCGVGRISMELAGNEEDYDYEISCGLGSVKINGTTYSSLSTDKEIDNHAGHEIKLDCGVGEIDVTVK